MEKNQLISLLKENLALGTVSKEELQSILSDVDTTKTNKNFHNNWVNVLYIIGTLIVLSGVIFLLAQFWDDIGLWGKILVTGGIGFIAYILGIILRGPSTRILSQVMFLVSGFLIPIGFFILVEEFGFKVQTMDLIVFYLVLAICYLVAWFVNKRSLLVFMIVVLAIVVYYLGLFEIASNLVSIPRYFLQYSTMLISVCLGFLAFAMKSESVADRNMAKELSFIRSLFYLASSFGFLIAGLFLDNMYNIIMIFVFFGLFYLSILIKNKSILFSTSILFPVQIGKITVEYFSEVINWPLFLIFIGMLIIAMAYVSLYINRNYIKKIQN